MAWFVLHRIVVLNMNQVALFLTCAAVVVAAETPDAILQKMNSAEEQRRARMREFQGTRKYVLKNQRWNKNAEMQVEVQYRKGEGRSFRVLASTGSEDIQNRVFKKLLEAEAEASKSAKTDPSLITPENSNVSLLGEEFVNGRNCYVLQINPKKKSKFLIEGKAWVDAEDYALVKLEGRPSASISFWVGRPWISQNFAKVGDQWMAASNHSVADSRLFGKTELHIEYSRYSINGSGTTRIASNRVVATE